MSLSPVFGILQNASMVDFPGKMAAVFFLSGCNFRCGFCHNANLMGRADVAGLPWTEVEQICRKFRDNWVNGAVVTGGEPTLNPGVAQVVEKLREWGFAIKLDTNGSRPRVLEKLLPLVDYVAMDVKFAPADYPERAGFSDIAALTESIRLIRANAAAYEFRTTVIEAWHDAEKMRAIGEWVRGAKLHVLQAFVPRDDLPDPACRKMPETRSEVMHPLADVLRHYVGRVEVRGEF
jgi:pyruvate formate lyase activating enzyme